MSKYEGLYTFDVGNHRYIPVGQADGIIDCFKFKHESKEPLIKDEKIRDIIRSWTRVNDVVELTYNDPENSLTDIFRNEISFNGWLGLKDAKTYTIEELCGEDEE